MRVSMVFVIIKETLTEGSRENEAISVMIGQSMTEKRVCDVAFELNETMAIWSTLIFLKTRVLYVVNGDKNGVSQYRHRKLECK